MHKSKLERAMKIERKGAEEETARERQNGRNTERAGGKERK